MCMGGGEEDRGGEKAELDICAQKRVVYVGRSKKVMVSSSIAHQTKQTKDAGHY